MYLPKLKTAFGVTWYELRVGGVTTVSLDSYGFFFKQNILVLKVRRFNPVDLHQNAVLAEKIQITDHTKD